MSYRVKTIVLSTGERCPVLLGKDAQPLFEPTIFALTEVRGRSRASNTICSVLRALCVFHLFLDMRGIDLWARLRSGKMLSLGEVEDLVRQCRRHVACLSEELAAHNPQPARVLSLEKLRMRTTVDSEPEVVPGVAATRLRYIRSYIKWLAAEFRSRFEVDDFAATTLVDATNLVVEAIEHRIPERRDTLTEREGLSDEHVEELLRVTDPLSPHNPWINEHARRRNALMVRWLLLLGPRIGEVLGVRVADVVPYRNEVTFHRRADDKDDPRTHQPQTKTRARELSIGAQLLADTQNYLIHHRSKFAGAKKNPFLFVATHTGRPLSMAAATKMFKVLRESCPRLPGRLSAHVLRHTWNDRFSREMDLANVSPEREHQIRCFVMGWSPTSSTASIYTRRHVRRRAQEVSLELQSRLQGCDENDK